MSIYNTLMESTIEESAIVMNLNEFVAKQKDMEAFNRASDMVKYCCNYYHGIVMAYVDVVDKLIAQMNDAKTEDDLKKLSKDVNDTYKELIKAKYAEYDVAKGGKGNTAHVSLATIGRKFGIKYSDVVMEDKKKIDKELEDLYDDINKKCTPFFVGNSLNRDNLPDKAVKWNDGIDNINRINSDIGRSVGVDAFNWYYQNLYRECVATLSDIAYARKALKLKKEKGLIFKLSNKIAKTPKDYKKAE